MKNDSPVLKVFDVDENTKNKLDKSNTTKKRSSPCCNCKVSESRLNEMWLLSIDPFVRISGFIAKLSKRQYCWRVFEDFQNQGYFKFFDVHRCLFIRLHFSIGGYDYRKTARFRQSIHCSRIQVLVADHVHWRSGIDNKISFLKFKSWCSKHLISEGEKNVALSCFFNFTTFLAIFHAASRAPSSCHSVSSRDRSSNFGALALRWWSSPGQM